MELDFIGWLTPRWRVLFDHMPDSMDGARILDAGCGQGVLGFLLAHNYPNDKYVLTGVDGYQPYIDILQRMRSSPFYQYVHCMPLDVLGRWIERSFDYVFCLDVLEHNDREYSDFVLDILMEITSKKLFITVPNEEPLHNEKRRLKWIAWRAASDNKYKGHVSSWSVSDFTEFETHVFDNRKDMTRSMRVFDSIRRKMLRVDWDEKEILAILDKQDLK